MRLSFLLILFAGLTVHPAQAQDNTETYKKDLEAFQKNYVDHHEVVKGADRQYLQFFPVDPAYHVICHFERVANRAWFTMPTASGTRQVYRRYGRLTFTVHDTTVHLYVYQSQSLLKSDEYRDYLFIPFTDLTTDVSSYGGGRYIDCTIKDIQHNTLELDFNKAYNPYCAYTSGYACPIPPAENALPLAIRAGEKAYGKKVTH